MQDTLDAGRLAGIDFAEGHNRALVAAHHAEYERLLGAQRNAFLRSPLFHALEQRLPAAALWPHRPGHSESKRVELNLSVTLEPDGRADELRLVVPGSASNDAKACIGAP